MRYLFMAVTTDKYELPLAVEEKAIDLANRLGINYSSVRNQINQKPKKPSIGVRCLKIEIEE